MTTVPTRRASLLISLIIVAALAPTTSALAANDHANDKGKCLSKDTRPWDCIEDAPGLLIASPARGEDEPEVAPETARAESHAANVAQLEALRVNRDVVGDETKQLQTVVDQLNDAASQQANMATAILQQLSGILALIFR